ncbi:MAG: TetR/AcrR family transcriptional regulator [Actinomycetota bacterium]|nr:TetR/AcrR family transcriptional regulator [Actinomycetota bacterium]
MLHEVTGPVKTQRPYRSPLRQEQAQTTAGRILAAASRLFVERGYTSTTMKEIAREAGVAERTVYVAFADKRSLLFAVLDAAIASDARPVPVSEREWFREVLEEPDAHRQLELFASAARAMHERTGELFRVLQSAAAVDPEVARHLTLHAEGQVEDERRLVESLAAKGALRPGLSPDEALETVWALTTPHFFAQVSQHGWSPSRYEQWLADALVRLLLPQTPAQSGHATDGADAS